MADRLNVVDDALDILFNARSEVISTAQQVGIDGTILLNALPASGQLLTGNKVPVIHKKYRGTCSVLFHINQTKSGTFWPLLCFHTFKHGGLETQFNGLLWLKQHRPLHNKKVQSKPVMEQIAPVHVNIQTPQQKRQCDLAADIDRANRYQSQLLQYKSATQLTPNHPWIAKRLLNYATPTLLRRISMRAQGNAFLLPIFHNEHGQTGFHKIITDQANGDKKYHFVKKHGLFKGSYITISAKSGFSFLPIALCEGVATGLTLALVWPGEIRVALSSGNMAEVRNNIAGDVIIFNDEDVWNANSGNVGRAAANSVKRTQDIVSPPTFSCASYGYKPTDFNDLLINDGFAALNKQINAVLSVCLQNSSATVTRLFS